MVAVKNEDCQQSRNNIFRKAEVCFLLNATCLALQVLKLYCILQLSGVEKRRNDIVGQGYPSNL